MRTLALCFTILLFVSDLSADSVERSANVVPAKSQDFILPSKDGQGGKVEPSADFKYKWLEYGGTFYDDAGVDRLEVASTLLITDEEQTLGGEIVRLMTLNMPSEVFSQLADYASVGLFTVTDKTTIFPEYENLADRPECEGTCDGACSDTCTGDGRKWDSLAGVGGIRGTCLDDNFMCTASDPYYGTFSVLVHEFGHTIHLYGLSADYYNQVEIAYQNAYENQIWDVYSYAMSNSMEYFAEGTGTFFNTNKHPDSSGGMNGCGKPYGEFCSSESEARDWLQTQDPMLFDILSYAFTNYQPSLPGGLAVCIA